MMYNKQTTIMALLQLVLSCGIRKKMNERDWVKVLLIAESKGILYYGFKDSRISKMAIAYRVPEITDSIDNIIPDKESGDILWVANFINSDKESIKKEAIEFFNRYKDINFIAFKSPKGEIIKIPRRRENEQRPRNKRIGARIL